MVRDYDTQLLESVAVRRRRLRDALLFGRLRARRTLDENLVRAFVGLVVAAVLCAGCVGWSFIQQQRRKQAEEQAKQRAGTAMSIDRRHGGPEAVNPITRGTRTMTRDRRLPPAVTGERRGGPRR